MVSVGVNRQVTSVSDVCSAFFFFKHPCVLYKSIFVIIKAVVQADVLQRQFSSGRPKHLNWPEVTKHYLNEI